MILFAQLIGFTDSFCCNRPPDWIRFEPSIAILVIIDNRTKITLCIIKLILLLLYTLYHSIPTHVSVI